MTVADAEDPPNSSTTWRAISVNADGTGPETTENEPPIAVFVVTPEAGYAGATLFTFDAGGSTDPDGPTDSLSYRWNFGDGFHATGMVATHIYEDPDADGYIVRLTVRDEENAPTDAMQLVVVKDNAGNLPPFAYIATGLRTGTAPATLTFDGRNSFDLNDDPIEFTWEFKKDGQPHDTLTGGLVTKLFEEAGTYTVELTVDDRRGGIAHAGPETIVITARSAGPGDDGDDDDQDEEPEQPIPSTGLRFCGLGMLMSLFGSLLGLTAMAATRRRFHL